MSTTLCLVLKETKGVPNNNEFINYRQVSDLTYTQEIMQLNRTSRLGYDYDGRYIFCFCT
jgi:hypothetical protein